MAGKGNLWVFIRPAIFFGGGTLGGLVILAIKHVGTRELSAALSRLVLRNFGVKLSVRTPEDYLTFLVWEWLKTHEA